MSFTNTKFDTFDSRYRKICNVTKKFGADPTGTLDAGPAIRSAISEQAGQGGTLYFEPGTYKIVSTATSIFLTLPANTTLLGDSPELVTFVITAASGRTYAEFIRNSGNNVTIRGVTIARGSDVGMVLFNVGPYKNFQVDGCVIDGNLGSYQTYCHALQLGNQNSTTQNVAISGTTIKNVTITTLMTNASTATVDGITIRECRYVACGISLNAPNGLHTNVWIENNVIDGTGAPAGAFGIDLAHVTNATIRDNTISNFAAEGIHIEDYSSNVSIVNNRLSACATGSLNSYGFMEVISGSNAIVIDGNTFDATGNSGPGPANAILSLLQGGSGNTAGGRPTVSPNTVTITNNTLLGGAIAHGIYIDQCPSSVIAHNKIIGTGAVSGGSYSGPVKSALRLAGMTGGQVNMNIIRGWNAAVEDVAQTLNGTLFTQNLLRDCNVTVTSRAFNGAYTAGTTLYNCVSTTTLN